MLHKFPTIALAAILFCNFATVSKSSELQDADYASATDLVSKGDCQRAWELIRDSIVTQPAVLDSFLTFAFSNDFRVYPSMEDEEEFAKFFIAVSISNSEKLDTSALNFIDSALFQIIDKDAKSAFLNYEIEGTHCREEAFFSLERKAVGEYLKEFVASMSDVHSYGYCPPGMGKRRKP
ncbi:hypothetical protein [Rhizobium wuzhouense]|uniref:Uncharacterized protein n=1 Tax=Rhizobium wuzhouense TaxID=1986026 RepID=A0ABX5NR29_9HYPH|nr:hypothetical protein [Rhizobium wuzhouense]PYB73041.1 hypothetical protein DMY87_11960 [Rhizobium wuzhouense]